MTNTIERIDNLSNLRTSQGTDTLVFRMSEEEGEEDISLREESVKHFDMGGNRRQAVIYSAPVHFRDPDSQKWEEIDNTLEAVTNAYGRRVMRNRSNRVTMEFPTEADGGNMASITDGNRTFGWSLDAKIESIVPSIRTGAEMKRAELIASAQRLPKYAGRTVESLQAADLEHEIESAQDRRATIAKLRAENSYRNVCPGISLRYLLNSESMKEDIIVANAEALNAVALRLPNSYLYKLTDDKRLLVLDPVTNQECFTMSPPLVIDSEGKETIADAILIDKGDYIRLAYIIPDDYIKEAVFPITIDPVVQTSTTNTAVCDAYIWAKNPGTNYGSVHLMRCGDGEGGESISLIKFNKLIKLKASDTVLSARLRVSALNYPSNPEIMGCYPIKTNWTETGVTWNNMTPANDTHISKDLIAYIPATNPTYCYFDVTAQYRDWYLKDANGNTRNFGVALRRPPEINSGGNYVEWTASQYNSSKSPCMVVNYVSHAGRKGWWQYEQMNAGRAGSAYVDLFNGNLVFEHLDGGTTGNRMPVSISHVYNSCLSESNPVSCGKGWRTSMHQSVYKKAIGSTSYYIWVDSDGTEHFFAISGSQPYQDSEGMSLKLTTASNVLTITDKSDMKMAFPQPSNTTQKYMTNMTDAVGNTANLTYDADGKLTQITDGVGRAIVLTYNTAGLLSSIAVPGRPTISYTYTNERLTGINYSDISGGTTYDYEAESNMLISATNFDGVQVKLDFEGENAYDIAAIDNYAAQVRRVISMETLNGSVKGAKQLFEYQYLTTKVTAVNNTASDAGKVLTYLFNSAGNVICTYDELGFAQSNTFSASIANQQTGASRLKKVAINLLTNIDFAANWSSVKGATADTVARDTATRCLGMPSLKMTKTGTAETKHVQTVNLSAAGKYTFSAYVKNTAELASGKLFLRIRSGSTVIESRGVTGITTPFNTDSAADGWDRLYVTMDMAQADSVTVELVSTAPSGSAWFACPQFESGSIANHVNLLLNGDFSRTFARGTQTFATDWSVSSGISTNAQNGVIQHESTDMPTGLSGNAMRIKSFCNTSSSSHCQSIQVKGAKGDVFVVGAWLNATSVASGTSHFKACIITRFMGTDGNLTDWQYNEYDPQRVGWKFTEWAIVAPKAYKEFRIGIQYARNTGTAMFTNVFVHREEFGQSFAYDSNKNIISTANLSTQKSDIQYDDANNIKSYRQPGAADTVKYTMNYGSSTAERKKHLLLSSVTPMGQRQVNTYDTFGNPLTSTSQKSGDTAFIKTETTYTNGNYTQTSKDACGNVVTQTVNATDGTLTSVTDPAGQTVNYTYDAAKRVTGVQTTDNGKTYKNAYTYENDRIKTVSHNTTSNTATDVQYTFDYDALGRKTTVKVGTQTLSTNVYQNTRNGLLSEVQYGNGGKVKYTYDDFDRMQAVRYDAETTDRYAYEYGANGQASVVRDNALGRTLQTQYDLAERAMGTQLRDNSGNLLYRTELDYDKLNRLVGFGEAVGAATHKTAYTYDNDNRVTGITYDGGNAITYTYDNLGRISTRSASPLSTTYGYVGGGYGSGSTTPLVSSIQQNSIAFAYAYDNRGNITSETRNGQTTTYAYDALGQLIRVNDPHENATWVFNYDRGGNILSKEKYAYTTGTLGAVQQSIPYVYGDSNWKDKLTSYNGQAITYDAIGNPLNDGTWMYTWGAGRQLRQMSKSGMTVQFQYDHNGLRVGKTVNGVATSYTLHGKLITNLAKGSDNLHFFYDAQSRPAKVDFNGTMYTYVHSLQGDIVGLLDNNGALVVEYKYDAWGKNLSTMGSLSATLGVLNPFRYRGYVYDEETGLYYLRSRYFNACFCRFINADCTIGRMADVLALNTFTYVYNAPLRLVDQSGCWPTWEDVGNAIQNVFCWLPRQMWQGVIWGLNKLGYKNSATLLNHSLQNNPPNLKLSGDSDLAASIKANNQYKTKFNDMAKRIMAGEQVSTESFAFTDTDLFGSLHKVQITVSGVEEDGQWTFDVNIHDRYDFTFQWDTYFSSLPMFAITTGNNMAWSDQFFGVIVNYDIDIDFIEEMAY